MPKIYSAKDVIKTLQKAGFTKISQKGSHIKLKGIKNGRIVTAIIPNHKTIAKGTFISILKQADMSKMEFEDYL